MKFAIVRVNLVTGRIQFRSKHSRWSMDRTSALLFEDSFAAVDYLHSFVRRSSDFLYEVRQVS